MTNNQKFLLRSLCIAGKTFDEIKNQVNCSDSTIKKYLKTFNKAAKTKRKKHTVITEGK